MFSGIGDGSGNPLSLTQKKELVATALEKRDMRNLVGTARVEFMRPKAVAALPAPENHVIGFIGAVAKETGFEHDGTFGGVLEFFGLPRGSKEAQDVAHELCCECHGPFVSTIMAAGRVRNIVLPRSK